MFNRKYEAEADDNAAQASCVNGCIVVIGEMETLAETLDILEGGTVNGCVVLVHDNDMSADDKSLLIETTIKNWESNKRTC